MNVHVYEERGSMQGRREGKDVQTMERGEGRGIGNDLDRGRGVGKDDKVLAMVLIEDVLMLLMLIEQLE